MKKTIVLAFFLLMSLPLLFNSCSNAPQSVTRLNDTDTTKDSGANTSIDTTPVTAITKTDTPVKPRFVEIRAMSMEDYDDEIPPPIEYRGAEVSDAYESSFPEPVLKSPSSDQDVLVNYEILPEFKELDVFIKQNLIYPENAKEFGVSGTSYIVFTVDQTGHVSDVRIKRSSGYPELDVEATRVIKKTSGLWTPGKFKGKITNMDIIKPITFEIDE